MLESDAETAYLWAQISITRRQQGHPISPQDVWIAACALRYDYPLLTHNATDYAGLPTLRLITPQ